MKMCPQYVELNCIPSKLRTSLLVTEEEIAMGGLMALLRFRTPVTRKAIG
jgi:hypothetical protein